MESTLEVFTCHTTSSGNMKTIHHQEKEDFPSLAFIGSASLRCLLWLMQPGKALTLRQCHVKALMNHPAWSYLKCEVLILWVLEYITFVHKRRVWTLWIKCLCCLSWAFFVICEVSNYNNTSEASNQSRAQIAASSHNNMSVSLRRFVIYCLTLPVIWQSSVQRMRHVWLSTVMFLRVGLKPPSEDRRLLGWLVKIIWAPHEHMAHTLCLVPAPTWASVAA